jgi:23S rRNA (guanosine2251-2'-O)-methyltransferase
MNHRPKSELVYGVHPVLERLAAEGDFEKIQIRRQMERGIMDQLRSLCAMHRIPLQEVPEVVLHKACPHRNHQGVIGWVTPIVYQRLDQLIPFLYDAGEEPLFVMLDGVTDVRNVGAIARSAEGMGAHGLVLPMQNSARINADALKTSSGALSHLPVCREPSLVQAIDTCTYAGLRAVACTERAQRPLYEFDLSGPMALVMGSEEDGIQPAVLRRCFHAAAIPMYGQVGSLNVSVSASIFLYEIQRQRNMVNR